MLWRRGRRAQRAQIIKPGAERSAALGIGPFQKEALKGRNML